MRFAFIAAENAHFHVTTLCRVMHVSTGGFYAWKTRPESVRAKDDRMYRVLIKEAPAISKGRYGSPRIHAELKDNGHSIGRKRVFRLMQLDGLRGVMKRRVRYSPASDPSQVVALNILDRNFTPIAPNQVWAGDTTELYTANGGKLYLAVVLDLFSRFVVGWALSATNDTRLVISALEMALKRRSPPVGLLHHSDQGSPYASDLYQRTLLARQIITSMSRRGNCYDNAVVESFFSTFKAELAETFESASIAKTETFEFIEVFYNQQRRHSSIGYRSPAQHEKVSVLAYQVAA